MEVGTGDYCRFSFSVEFVCLGKRQERGAAGVDVCSEGFQVMKRVRRQPKWRSAVYGTAC